MMAALQVENRGIEDDLFNTLVSLFQTVPSFKSFGFSFVYLDHGRVGMEMAAGPEYANHIGTAHGGITGALLDTVIGVSAWSMNFNVVTLEMNLNYIAPLKIGETVKAEGWVIHAGRTSVIAEGEIRSQAGKLIAKGRITYYRTGTFI